MIANLALDGLEALLKDHYPTTTRRGKQARVNLVKYADDFIISGSSVELLEQEVKPLVEQFLRERGLELSPEKTRITHIEDGFDFLGQNVRKYAGKLLIKPARKNVKAFLGKVRQIVKANKQATAANLIAQLNPMIRGWANYHRHVVSKQTFGKTSFAIFKALWRWAKHRHPNKSGHWIKKKYFHVIGHRKWVFCGEIKDQTGNIRKVQLFHLTDVPIKRHIKISTLAILR